MSAAPPFIAASFCVLASSSRGNCSVVRFQGGDRERVLLIDAGLSPRRTRDRFADAGIADAEIMGVVLTHLDHDHWNLGWLSALPPETPVFMHRRHRQTADRQGASHARTEAFDGPFEPSAGVVFYPEVLDHDELGVAVFRVEFTDSGRRLGYATDLGRPSEPLVRHLSDVEVLAIESNYCPDLQEASDRPAVLKDRIMGGAGHLSNQEAAWAAHRIAPRERVVLLHLSQECNTEARALAAHGSSRVPVIAARVDGPTPWIPLSWPGAVGSPRRAAFHTPHRQATLWGAR